MAFYVFFRKHATSDRILIASSQILGFISFYFVVNGANEQTIRLMSLYVCFQAASAFLLLAIQFSDKRGSVLSARFVIFLLCYFVLILQVYKGSSNANPFHEMIIAGLFLTVVSIQLYLTALEEYTSLLILQLLFAILLPFVVIFPVPVISIVILVLIVVASKFNFYMVFRSASFSIGDVKSWSLSILMQAPFILYALFDPSLSARLDIEVYGMYLIYSKFIFGVVNFIFSFFQFKLIRREELKVDKLPYLIFSMVFLSLFLSQFLAPLYVQVALFAVVVNGGSLYVRGNLKLCRLRHVLVAIASVGLYGAGLIFFSDEFFLASNNWFLPFLTVCTFLSVFSVWCSTRSHSVTSIS